MNDLDDNVDRLSSKFVDDTKIAVVINNQEDCRVIQSDKEQLKIWVKSWQIKFNPSERLYILGSQMLLM